MRPNLNALLVAATVACTQGALGLNANARPARVELLTIGPGEALESRFGHAVLCVFSSEYPRGQCFNYGATRAREGLLGQVILGDAVFLVKPESYAFMLALYRSEQRDIYRQLLPLTSEQAHHLIERLEHDAHPAHREYLYRPFTDNCATRVRDVIDEVTGGVLRSLPHDDTETTYREYVRNALSDQTALLVALDLALGSAGDQRPSAWDAMFAPNELRAGVQRAFDSEAFQLHAGIHRRAPASPWKGRSLVTAIAFVVFALAALAVRAGGLARKLAFASIGSLLSAIALVPLALAARSSLPEAWPNYVVFVWMPTDITIAILAVAERDSRPRAGRLLRWYLVIRTTGLIALAGGALTGVITQSLLPAIAIPLGAAGGGLVGLLGDRSRANEPCPSQSAQCEATTGEKDGLRMIVVACEDDAIVVLQNGRKVALACPAQRLDRQQCHACALALLDGRRYR